MQRIISVYAVFATPAEAREIGRAMVEERLAACVNILGPCHSIYCWEGGLEEATETPALFKTTAAQAPALMEGIAARHSYEVPAITIWPVEQSFPAYAQWAAESIGT